MSFHQTLLGWEIIFTCGFHWKSSTTMMDFLAWISSAKHCFYKKLFDVLVMDRPCFPRPLICVRYVWFHTYLKDWIQFFLALKGIAICIP